MCIYIFVCPELIEETVSATKLIFGMWGYFGSTPSEFGPQKKMSTHH